jgi:hypothetical protein
MSGGGRRSVQATHLQRRVPALDGHSGCEMWIRLSSGWMSIGNEEPPTRSVPRCPIFVCFRFVERSKHLSLTLVRRAPGDQHPELSELSPHI